jgi:hypothetical protein
LPPRLRRLLRGALSTLLTCVGRVFVANLFVSLGGRICCCGGCRWGCKARLLLLLLLLFSLGRCPVCGALALLSLRQRLSLAIYAYIACNRGFIFAARGDAYGAGED